MECRKFSILISTALDLKENSVQIENKMLKLHEYEEKIEEHKWKENTNQWTLIGKHCVYKEFMKWWKKGIRWKGDEILVMEMWELWKYGEPWKEWEKANQPALIVYYKGSWCALVYDEYIPYDVSD